MTLRNDLDREVAAVFDQRWSSREGEEVPDPTDLKLGNEAVEFARVTIIYADLSDSTTLVDRAQWTFAAEVYKTYLLCAARLITDAGGEITSYDGDRVMGVFITGAQTTSAAKCALKINYAVQNIINPALRKQYPEADFEVRQVVGIDTSPIHAARTGVRGDNDIVWVGSAANHAAKLTQLNSEPRTWATERAFNKMNEELKLGGNPKQPMWKKYTWTQQGGETIYGSTWTWRV